MTEQKPSGAGGPSSETPGSAQGSPPQGADHEPGHAPEQQQEEEEEEEEEMSPAIRGVAAVLLLAVMVAASATVVVVMERLFPESSPMAPLQMVDVIPAQHRAAISVFSAKYVRGRGQPHNDTRFPLRPVFVISDNISRALDARRHHPRYHHHHDPRKSSPADLKNVVHLNNTLSVILARNEDR